MKISALLETTSKDAGTVAAALDVDNIKLDGLRVKTKKERNRIITRIEADNMDTLIHTLDDIILCQIVAEKTIE